MTEIRNVRVYDLEESVIASGYAMGTELAEFDGCAENLKFWMSKGEFLSAFTKYYMMQGKNVGFNTKNSCKKCGSDEHVQQVKDFGYYCGKHAHELYRYGKIVDKVTYDFIDDYNVSITIRRTKNETAKVIISAIDVPLVFGRSLRLSRGYLYVDGKGFHRLLGESLGKSSVVYDHINRNPSDNRRCNLRAATIAENVRNANKYQREVPGVRYEKRTKSWIAYISVGKKQIFLGRHKQKDDAIIVRLKKEQEMFGEFSPNIGLFERYGIDVPKINSFEGGEVYSLKKAVNAFKRAIRLVGETNKNNHVKCFDNFQTGIRVSFDVKYPQFITPELQRYHWIDIVTSSSKMHKMLFRKAEEACNEYTSQSQIDTLQFDIDRYNRILKDEDFKEETFVLRSGKVIVDTNKDDALYHARIIAMSDCPMGYELFMRVSTNYKQLQTIYWQRHDHRLKEDWGVVCDFILSLPYAKEFILCE